ncbi:carboxylesterase/lipase family protein [Rathayibacter sp. VKM Ac-2754]|uniref:carboxylesterase/lipase family protein n=1 Tax=Rathayibacter sp. VKM Ac-2754 TaxID=2609251 RepID=UPI0013567545|nr:carboxylesterase family protein [Rathayibacter sp. VKM Ac-2754]MWV59184.1 carboxylesterase family protein [Rathayibacter sp. VKM Ac-2754]
MTGNGVTGTGVIGAEGAVGMDISVEAPCGAVVGRIEGGIARFLGVPFAEAPTGELRFRAPEPRARFAEPFDASAYGATPQRGRPFEFTTIPEHSIPGADTLTLNVVAPVGASSLPVLVYLHGGGYVTGAASSDWHDGSAFARDGVIVVTAAYRLGVDGFAVIEGDANRAVRDWLAALRWVQANIAAFGGDPSRVTIAGQSAGGGAVLTLLGCAEAQPLFARAVAISPTDRSVPLAEASAQVAAFALGLGVAPDRAGFASLDPDELSETAARTMMPGASIVFAPVTGDDLLPEPVATATALAGRDKPLLIGATADEFDTPRIERDADAPPRATDLLFRRAVVQAARNRADGPAPTWLYAFDWVSPAVGGAGHCLDLPFFFDHLDAEATTRVLGDAPPAALAATMHRELVAFVSGADPAWPPARCEAGDSARVYDVEPAVVAGRFDDVLPLVGEHR